MAALPYMQLYVADYLADTAHLTIEEHGAYLMLIMNYWQRGKPLNNVNGRLATVLRVSNDRWISLETTLAEFFQIEGDIWHHDRIDRELANVNRQQTQRVKAGKASAEARKNTASERSFNGRSTGAQRMGRSTNPDTDTDTDTDKNKRVAKATTPIAEIVLLYHDYLPNLPKCQRLTAKRSSQIHARWGESPEVQTLGWWQAFFEKVGKSEFLNGKNDRGWTANLEWITKSENFTKILEGHYDRKSAHDQTTDALREFANGH